jgi:F0F1-type ATP synthase membrane subunit c/vacuolar-type H+-ATPase subunit K
MVWIRLAATVTVFVTSCVGLGYLAGFWVRRRNWPVWVGGLMSFAIGCLWPAIAIGSVIYTGRRYVAEHPGEVNDAPAMVLMGVMTVTPFIFAIGLSLALIGSHIARRRSAGEALR